MDRHNFASLTQQRILVLDGATGTELIKRGMPSGVAPEQWCLENPEVVQAVHRDYYAAGSDIVLACTFGANRIKLEHHGLQDQVNRLNTGLALISRKVVPEGKWLFGDLSPTGQLIEPLGPLAFEEAVAAYKEQALALLEGGVDGFMIETMIDIQEARAAVLGVREAAPLHPIMVSLTFDGSGRTLGGTPPEAAVVTLQSLGADAVGCNCSTGPKEMLTMLGRMQPYASVPLFIKPNAGMPVMRDGCNHYEMSSEPFADAVLDGIRMGARIVGGCCGTTPEHIHALRQIVDANQQPCSGSVPIPALSSARAVVDFERNGEQKSPVRLIGERINPTGKKVFQQELLDGDLSRVLDFAEEQIDAGADLLDVNFGLGGLDEAETMRQAIAMLAPTTAAPLVIDSVDAATMETALRLYPGRALVNSISGEKDRLETILPLAAKYGAMIIALPVGDGFIPAKAGQRMEVVESIVKAAQTCGLDGDDILVDGLAMTVSADPASAAVALDCIRQCTARGWRTVLGLSNISFGMPERPWLNSAFMAMAVAHGLSAVIANPSAKYLMETKSASDALCNRNGGVAAYIDRFARPVDEAESESKKKNDPIVPAHAVESAEQAARSVLAGRYKQSGSLSREAVDNGLAAGALVSGYLVPAIVQAGKLYEQQKYYLPQLMLAGEAMRLALAAVEGDLAKERNSSVPSSGKVLMATVQGDVHDIGKNLVSLMLRNHGFEVLDLGKDVSPESILNAAREFRPDVIGLSALMTTTLKSMKEAVVAIRKDNESVRIMVGGAAVTEEYAQFIGADGYSSDAVGAVRLAGSLVSGEL